MSHDGVHILIPYLIAAGVMLIFMMVAVYMLKQDGDRQKALYERADANRTRSAKG